MPRKLNRPVPMVKPYTEEFRLQVEHVLWKKHHWRWMLLTTWIILFTGVAFLAIRVNRERVNDIQHARVESCQRTYFGVEQIFQDVFLPPDESTWDVGQRRIAAKFHKTVEHRASSCGKQTGVDGDSVVK
jgi:hypothetical protein